MSEFTANLRAARVDLVRAAAELLAPSRIIGEPIFAVDVAASVALALLQHWQSLRAMDPGEDMPTPGEHLADLLARTGGQP